MGTLADERWIVTECGWGEASPEPGFEKARKIEQTVAMPPLNMLSAIDQNPPQNFLPLLALLPSVQIDFAPFC
jgi:hypothetical protein